MIEVLAKMKNIVVTAKSPMPKPAAHTVVRFKLRSLLAITFGVAVVMAVWGSSLREMPTAKQQHLLYALLAMAGGMACTGTIAIRNRLRLGEKCGRLLVNLEISSPKKRNWSRWLWLLILVPLTALFFYAYIDKAISSQRGLLSSLPNMIFPFVVSIGLTRYGLAVWAEGYANAIDFCEQGIVIGEEFHNWNDRALRQLYWSTNAECLVVNINRHPISVTVPPHQREAVDAILKHYYEPARKATDQT